MTIVSHQRLAFLFLWAGQTVSLLGSSLTGFALGVWIYQRTGTATPFALIALAGVLPRLLLAPLAGALVDRWDRRWAMLLSDSGSALVTLAQVLLLAGGRLEVWHIILAAGASAAFGTLQYPAYSAAISQLVSKNKLGRANGLVQLGKAASEILAPSLGGLLVVAVGVQGVIAIDFATYLLAGLSLLLVRVPLKVHPTEAEAAPRRGSLLREAAEGWQYLRSQPGMLGLAGFFAVVGFVWTCSR